MSKIQVRQEESLAFLKLNLSKRDDVNGCWLQKTDGQHNPPGLFRIYVPQPFKI